MTNDLLRFLSAEAAGRVEEEEEERGGKSILGPHSTSHIRSVKKRRSVKKGKGVKKGLCGPRKNFIGGVYVSNVGSIFLLRQHL